MSLNNIFNSLCQPAQLYFILAIFSFTFQMMAILMNQTSYKENKIAPIMIHMIIYVLVTIIWIWLLNGMCKIGGIWGKISWFIALFPIIVFLMMLMGVINSLSSEMIDGNLDQIITKCNN